MAASPLKHSCCSHFVQPGSITAGPGAALCGCTSTLSIIHRPTAPRKHRRGCTSAAIRCFNLHLILKADFFFLFKSKKLACKKLCKILNQLRDKVLLCYIYIFFRLIFFFRCHCIGAVHPPHMPKYPLNKQSASVAPRHRKLSLINM